MGDRQIIPAVKKVFGNPKYILLAIAAAIGIFSLNIILTNYHILLSSFSFALLNALLFGASEAMRPLMFATLLGMSVFGGVLLSMAVFLLKRQVRAGLHTGSGVVLSIVAPGCGACAIGPLSAIGLGSVLAVLPFKGLEITLLAFGILLFALNNLSNKIMATSCTLKK